MITTMKSTMSCARCRQLIGTGKYIASALGVWAMMFLTVTIIGSSLIPGRKRGAIFRV